MSEYYASAEVPYTRIDRNHRYRGRVKILDNGYVSLLDHDEELLLPPHAVEYVIPFPEDDEE